jgi:hypothetical protein
MSLLEPNNEELERRAKLVADELNGMQPHALVFYQLSIRYSAERCLDSFWHYEEGLKQNAEPDYLVSVIQEAVGHAAALSRYFWPSPFGNKNKHLLKLKQKRGEYLRKLFNLDRDSPLYNRDLRNAWEHFDEKLDVFLIEKVTGMFFPMSQIGSHQENDSPINRVFKLLDPNEECLVLMGNKYFFAPIREEVLRIYDQLEENMGTKL